MFEESIEEAKRLLSKTNDIAHDIGHAQRVAENAALIGKELSYKNIEFLRLCAWWHDVGRIVSDEGHEEISANMLKQDLLKRGSGSIISQRAYDAIVFHKWSMKPSTIEGNIIRDADKLDFISIERWQSCLNHKQLKHLEDIKELLEQLPKLLSLKVSRMVYKKRLPIFAKSRLYELI